MGRTKTQKETRDFLMTVVIKTHQNNNKKHINFFGKGPGPIIFFFGGGGGTSIIFYLLFFFFEEMGGGGGGPWPQPVSPPSGRLWL
jgi:hypothetical protein